MGRHVIQRYLSFGEWWDRTLRLDRELEALADDDSIPEGPDRSAVEAWSVATHLRYWEAARAGGYGIRPL